MSYEEVYAIPDEIKAHFSEVFYKEFWNELISVFGDSVKGVDCYCYPMVCYFSGTGGWSDALKATCKKLGLVDVWSYYASLAWYDSDRFDGEVADELVKRFSKPTNADHIRSMTDEELAEFMCHNVSNGTVNCAFCGAAEFCRAGHNGWLDWLKQEVSE